MVGMEPDLKMVSSSSYDFLCASKYPFCAFIDNVKWLLIYRLRTIYKPQFG